MNLPPVIGVLLGVVGPAFAVVASAWLAVRLFAPPPLWITRLQRATFDVLIPVMLFNLASRIELPAEVPWGVIVAYFGPTLLLFAAPLALAISRARGLRHAALLGFAVTYSNAVLLGIPITLSAFGEEAALPLFVVVSLNSPLLFTALALAAADEADDGHPLALLARRTLGNPILLALLCGLIVNLADWAPFGPVSVLLDAVSALAPKVALLAMGAGLASYRLRGEWRGAAGIGSTKLLLHPLLVYAASTAMGLDGATRATLTVLAAMPVGINVYLMALRYRTLEPASALAVALSTLASVVTLTLLISALR